MSAYDDIILYSFFNTTDEVGGQSVVCVRVRRYNTVLILYSFFTTTDEVSGWGRAWCVSAYDDLILYSFFTTTDEVGGADGSHAPHPYGYFTLNFTTLLILLLFDSYFTPTEGGDVTRLKSETFFFLHICFTTALLLLYY